MADDVRRKLGPSVMLPVPVRIDGGSVRGVVLRSHDGAASPLAIVARAAKYQAAT